MLKVLLVIPANLLIAKSGSCPLGVLSIASYLKDKGHIVKIIDRSFRKDDMEKHIKSFSPDVVGVSVISALASRDAIEVSKIVKKHKITVVWGGYIASVLPELCFKEGCVDFIVIGEGEITFSELLDAIEKGKSFYNVDGLAFVDRIGLHINKEREVADLSSFPCIDWSLLDIKKYVQPYILCNKMLYIYSSKGCPAKCTFCLNSKLHRSSHRTRSPEHVVNDIEYLIKNYSIDGVYFGDEFWHPKNEDRQKFFDLISERKLDFVWGCQTRLGTYNNDDLQQMYDAGCRWILFGIESGCKDQIINR